MLAIDVIHAKGVIKTMITNSQSNWWCLSFSLTQRESDQLRSEPVILKGEGAIFPMFKWSMDRTV